MVDSTWFEVYAVCGVCKMLTVFCHLTNRCWRNRLCVCLCVRAGVCVCLCVCLCCVCVSACVCVYLCVCCVSVSVQVSVCVVCVCVCVVCVYVCGQGLVCLCVCVCVCQGKLVVGHNMILDVLHTVEQFITPLPHVTTITTIRTTSHYMPVAQFTKYLTICQEIILTLS